MEEEIWKDIPGYEGLYQASSLGKIKSLDRITRRCSNTTRCIKGKIIKQRLNRNRYLKVQLYKEGKGKWYTVHRLIATTFIPNPENKPEIDHINTVRTDNRIKNLRWVTRKENMANETTKEKAIEIAKTVKYYIGKKVKCITTGEIFDTITEAGIKYNIYPNGVNRCCKGKQKTAKGYKFEYYKE